MSLLSEVDHRGSNFEFPEIGVEQLLCPLLEGSQLCSHLLALRGGFQFGQPLFRILGEVVGVLPPDLILLRLFSQKLSLNHLVRQPGHLLGVGAVVVQDVVGVHRTTGCLEDEDRFLQSFARVKRSRLLHQFCQLVTGHVRFLGPSRSILFLFHGKASSKPSYPNVPMQYHYMNFRTQHKRFWFFLRFCVLYYPKSQPVTISFPPDQPVTALRPTVSLSPRVGVAAPYPLWIRWQRFSLTGIRELELLKPTSSRET